LQKSVLVEFEVVNSSDQIEAHGKSLSAITIPLTQDTKHLQPAENMFDQNSFSCRSPIPLLFFLCQGLVLGFLERRLAVFVEFCQALITGIRQNTNVLGNLSLVILEKLKVMFTSISKSRGYDFSGLLLGDPLRFLRVALLFTAVMPVLAFLAAQSAVR